MPDLFPGSLDPEALRDDILPYLRPVFFAIYPADEDRRRITEWQNRLCADPSIAITPRRVRTLHVSVAACGRRGRKRQSLQDALQEAARHFSFQPFDLTFDATACFSQDAFVAIADEASQQRIHELRIAVADAQRWAGLFGSRGNEIAHLTLGYGDNLPEERRPIAPFRFHVGAVDLVMSNTGQSEHIPLDRWSLRAAKKGTEKGPKKGTEVIKPS